MGLLEGVGSAYPTRNVLSTHERLGERLMLVIIPDEFQVNDELFEVLMKRVDDPGSYDREYPQMRIRGFARERLMRACSPRAGWRSSGPRTTVFEAASS